MNEDKLKLLEREFLLIYKEIDIINKELVVLLNKIENEYSLDTFYNDSENEALKLWEKVSKARNFNIY